ncbi:MAG: 16S rRNA (adenine(1518)-N(6)/adenine(1519)-N(6))-dimethyltransferase RsmA [Pseudomonadota bacterium]|nr:16S rRNA (adenine(1518)-N(6)/adenine(1519)-N(6))-dimethyltransferase RsmA [Pseudomonadota bacterium]
MPEPPPDLPPLRDVISRHGLAARRKLGQNFLLDLNLTGRIARAAGPLTDVTVIEIGPGPGGLTRALLETDARQIIALERDRRCIAALDELATAYSGRLQIVEGDALETDLTFLAEPGATLKIVANLPYNIATPLLIKWLRQIDDFAGMTLMFQKEVAQRLVAAPGSKSYGRLSIIAGWLCGIEAMFDISPQAFVPPPKVTSTVVALTPRAQPLAPARMEVLERVTAAAFGQRRKMLRSSLKSISDDPAALLIGCGIDPTARAEELDITAFCALARAIDGEAIE